MLICLIGMDGSGKTTHCIRLLSHLNESGDKCRYVWFGNVYFFSCLFMTLCRVLGLTKIHHLENGLPVSEHHYYSNKPISEIWPWVQFVDLLILLNLRVRLPLRNGYTLVCDRFIPDILVELITDINNYRLYERLVGRLMLRLIPDRALMIFLDVTLKTAWQRKHDVPELGYLVRRRKAYKVISSQLNMNAVDSERSVVVVQRHLVSIVDRWRNQNLASK